MEQESTRIFGTPSEPLFNNSFGLSPSLLEETLHVLAEDNETRIDMANEKQGHFKNGKNAEYIFMLCEAFNLPIEAKYLAVEIFDRFMSKHICSLYNVIRCSSANDKLTDWNDVETRLASQMPLRLLSCIQLASKLCSHYKALTSNKIRRYLNSIEHHFTNNSILKSELRILKTLDHCLPLYSPLTYIEIILEILGYNAGKHVKILYEISQKLLDVVYILNEQLYIKLLVTATGETYKTAADRHKLSILAADYMLLASGVIGAASFIINQHTSDEVVAQLSTITLIPEEDILDFATIIVEKTLQ